MTPTDTTPWWVCIWCREPVTTVDAIAQAHTTPSGQVCEHAGEPADWLFPHERPAWLAARTVTVKRGPSQLSLWRAA